MSVVTRTTTIAAPREVIWRILTRLDEYADWETGYVSSEYTGYQPQGVGATRRVELRSPMGTRRADHRVTRWDDQRSIAWAATDTNFPLLKSAEQTVTLAP